MTEITNQVPSDLPGKTDAAAINDVQSILDRMARLPSGSLHKDTIPNDLPEDSAFSKMVQHWKFVQRDWARKHHGDVEESAVVQPEPDVELFHQLSISLLNHIERQAAIRYAALDAGFNIIRRGVQADLDIRHLNKYLDDLEGLRLSGELISLFDLHEYKHEIMLREIDRVFGTATSLESEQRKKESDDNQYRQDMLELAVQTAQGVKDMGATLRSSISPASRRGQTSLRKRRHDGQQSEPNGDTNS